jgi:putative ABC transport system permease protein
MIVWMRFAFRNILRNKRRSLTTLFAIAVGFAAISLFRGYASNMYSGLTTMAVRGEGLGHLTIFKKNWREKGKLDPEKYMFSKAEIEKISRIVTDENEVVLATPQINLSGIVSNGTVSTIFIAQGVVPGDDRVIKGDWTALRPITGEGLDENKTYGVEMAQDLARFLNLAPGRDGVVMAPTLGGQMNALDIHVSGVFDTSSEATNDKYMRLSFAYAQSLLDTEKADRIVVLLKDTDKTEKMRSLLLARLVSSGIACEIRTWNELSLMYSKVRGMMDMIFLFIFCIVLVIAVMSIVNTMGMAVLERTREIGTLRALGLKRRGVSLLFAIEGGLLGFIGSLVGVGLHACVWAVIHSVKPTYVPPGISTPVVLRVSFVPQALIFLGVCLIALSLIAAIVPAKRAAGQNIVNALGHT